MQLVQALQFSCSSSQEVYLAQFLTSHILGHTRFKPPGIMLKNYSDFPQSLKEISDEITEIGHSHIF